MQNKQRPQFTDVMTFLKGRQESCLKFKHKIIDSKNIF